MAWLLFVFCVYLSWPLRDRAVVRVRYFVEGFVVRLVSFKGLVFLFLLAGLAPGSARPDAPDKVASALLFLHGHIKAWGLV